MPTRNYDQSGIGSSVELGKRGPKIKDNAGVIEHRNQSDSAFVVVRGDHPVGENDFVTKRYLETRSGASVTEQLDGGSPPTPGASPGTLYICTTADTGYTLGYLYYDNGTTLDEIVPFEGMSVAITKDLTGGTDTYLGDHIYLWDAQGTPGWRDIGPGAGETKLTKAVSLSVGYADAGTIPLVTVPVNAIVTRVLVNVTQAWGSPLPSMKVGDTTIDRHAADKDIDLNKVGIYEVTNLYLYGSATTINITLANNTATPATGVARVLIEYALA